MLYIFASIAVALVIIVITVIAMHGAFKKIKVLQSHFGPYTLIYLQFQGKYDKVGKIFQQIYQDTKDVFKISPLVGLYYDDPQYVLEKSLCRSAIGLLVNPGEQFKLQKFLSTHTNYQVANLPQVKTVFARFPFLSKLSIYFCIYKLYSAIWKFVEMKKIYEEETGKCFMEVYYAFDNILKKRVEVNFVHGPNSEQYYLTTYIKPFYKTDKCN